MIKCAIIMLISLALESIINLNISFTSYLVPLFSLLSLILIYKFLKYNKKEYFIFAIVSGFIYDLVFTNFYVLNSVLFLLNSFIIYFYFKKMKYNLFNAKNNAVFDLLYKSLSPFFKKKLLLSSNASILSNLFKRLLPFIIPLSF